MTDIQVSKSRRIGFTALAVIAFWLVAWGAYEHGADTCFGSLAFRGTTRLSPSWSEEVWESFQEDWTFRVLAFAITPVIFLLVANDNSPVRACRDRFVLGASALVLGSVAVSSWIGSVDVEVAIEAWLEARPDFDASEWWGKLPVNGPWQAIVSVSWTLFLLPIILTTAFVIFGAWRWARDAATELVGDDE